MCYPLRHKLLYGLEAPQTVREGEEVIFSYDVLFRVRCAHRVFWPLIRIHLCW